MARIPVDEEFSRDWDWFAVDEDGRIGHFATGGDIALPESTHSDLERAEAICPELLDSGIFKGHEKIVAKCLGRIGRYVFVKWQAPFSGTLAQWRGGISFYLMLSPDRHTASAALPLLNIALNSRCSLARFNSSLGEQGLRFALPQPCEFPKK